MTGLPPPTRFAGRLWSPGELDALAAGWWADLRAAMPRPCPVVATVLPSHPEGVALFFALSALPGAVAMLAEEPTARGSLPPLPADAHIVLPPVLAHLAAGAGRERRVIVLPERPAARAPGHYQPFSFAGIVAFTSGSTGLPKPVCWSGSAFFESARAATLGLGLVPGDGVLGALPLTHTHGLRGVLAAAIVLGGPLALLPRFDHRSVLALFAAGECRHFPCTPLMADLLARCPLPGPPPRPPELIRVSTGRLGEPVSRAFTARFGVPLRPGYGATESGILTQDAGPASEVRWDCVGRPVPGVEIRIGDDPTDPFPPGAAGRVWFRAPARMAGYGFPPALEPREQRAGWFPTADAGTLDAEGRLALTGRFDDQFKTAAGQLVDPAVVAAVLRDHPGVREVAVVPLHGTSGAGVGALVEGEPALEPAALRALAGRRLPPWARPHAVRVVSELPRTGTGKIDRDACIAALTGGGRGIPLSPAASEPAPSPRRGPGDPLEVMLVDIWADVLERRPVPVGESFAALGGDAALAATMIERVEQACGVSVPAGVRSSDVSIARLAVAIRSRASASVRPEQRGLVARNLPREGQLSLPELFFLHGDFNGGGFYCLTLAGHLGKGQPFHGLPPHGLDGRPLPPTIAAMAADRLGMLRALRPHGPYRLAGHCNGALVAFEMARRLRADGEGVERLILLSARLPAIGRPWRARVRARIEALARLVLAREPEAPPAADPGADPRDALYDAYRRIMAVYTPGSYEGRLTLLWPADDDAARRAHATRRWGRAAPQLSVRLVPGAHLTCITTHAAALAEAIRDCLGAET